jgi:hypothetical protein
MVLPAPMKNPAKLPTPRKPRRNKLRRSLRSAVDSKERLAQPIIRLDPATVKTVPVVRLSYAQIRAEEILDNVKPSRAKRRLAAWTAQWLEKAESQQQQQAKPHGKRRKLNRRGRKRTVSTSNPKG